MDVPVRELKSRLSEYLRLAAQGQRIRVTDRGVPRAMLTPLESANRIEQGIREGWVTRGAAVDAPPSVPRRHDPLPGLRSEAVLDEDRGT